MSSTLDLPTALDCAVTALVDELGADAVITDPARVAEFADPYRREHHANAPTVVVQPDSTAGVAAVLRVATAHGVPVGVSSQGRNFGYGGAEPPVPGAIALNLRRMNRVVEIDDELGYAVVEPGVTFHELYDALRAGGHPYWISCPDLGWGSVIGNACDHGVGYAQMGEHAAALCGLEVVLPDGDLVRTGMGGVEVDGAPSRLWHVQRRPFGPVLEGLFTQSNLGVITRAGVWLQPMPEAAAVASVIARREADLVPLIDTLRPLMMDGTVDGYPLLQHGFGIIALGAPREAWPGPGTGTGDQLEAMLGGMGLGVWILGRIGIYGSPEVVTAKQARLRAAFERAIPDAQVVVNTYGPPYVKESVPYPDQHALGIPGMEILGVLDKWGGQERGGHVDFSPATPFTGRDAMAAYRVMSDAFARHDAKSIYAVIARDRSLLHVNMIMFDRGSAAEVDAAHAAAAELIPAAHALGYGEYRAHPDHAAAVAAGYTHNDHALHRLLGRLKDAVDPAGILAPGRHGVWPSRRARNDHEESR